MLLTFLRTLSTLFWRLPILSHIKEAFVDWQSLTLSRRLLALGGYVALACLLGFLLVVEFFGIKFRQVPFTIGETAVQVPFVVMVVSSLGYAVGWSYILTGATDFRRRAFWLILGLYAVQLFLLLPTSNAVFLWLCTAPPLLILIVVIHTYGRDKSFIREWPLVEFCLWLGINFFFLLMFWLFDPTDSSVALSLNANFSLLMLLTLVFWAVGGLSVARLAVHVGRMVVMVARRLFPERFLRVMTLALLLARPLFSLAAASILTRLDNPVFAYMTFFDLFLVIPLTFLTVIMAVLGRWQLRPALTLLALSFGVPVFTLGVGLAFVGQDMTDTLALSLESLNLFPPLVLFTALLVHEVLTAGIPFSRYHSETMPRSGRLFLVFGMALLVVSFTIFNTSTTDATTGQIHNNLQIIVNALFSLSALILGFPYLGWVVWRKREELIGDEGEFASMVPLFDSLDRIHWGVWLALGIGIMFGASGLCCLSALLLTPVN